MNLLRHAALAASFGIALVASFPAVADPVSCGNPPGARQFTVNPALVGGYCYGQNGNFNQENTLFNALVAGMVIVDKDTTTDFPLGDNSEGALQFTRGTSSSGNWSFLASLWNTWDRLFLAAHYGGGGDTNADNPDSFIVELNAFDFAGTYALTGVNIQLNGLSNLYLLGVRCTAPGCNQKLVPEPATLLLLGAGALGLALRRRRA